MLWAPEHSKWQIPINILIGVKIRNTNSAHRLLNHKPRWENSQWQVQIIYLPRNYSLSISNFTYVYIAVPLVTQKFKSEVQLFSHQTKCSYSVLFLGAQGWNALESTTVLHHRSATNPYPNTGCRETLTINQTIQ